MTAEQVMGLTINMQKTKHMIVTEKNQVILQCQKLMARNKRGKVLKHLGKI